MPEASRPASGSGATEAPTPTSDMSTGQLIGQLSEQSSQLIRREVQLAQLEMQEKAKKVGMGAGLFGAAGVVALYGLGALIATAILALALAMPAWLAALIVAVVLFVVAGVMALLGKRKVSDGTPLAPRRAVDNVKQDLATVKEARS